MLTNANGMLQYRMLQYRMLQYRLEDCNDKCYGRTSELYVLPLRILRGKVKMILTKLQIILTHVWDTELITARHSTDMEDALVKKLLYRDQRGLGLKNIR
jgi:hypothetical protein